MKNIFLTIYLAFNILFTLLISGCSSNDTSNNNDAELEQTLNEFITKIEPFLSQDDIERRNQFTKTT